MLIDQKNLHKKKNQISILKSSREIHDSVFSANSSKKTKSFVRSLRKFNNKSSRTGFPNLRINKSKMDINGLFGRDYGASRLCNST